jgi:hypothetical protein
MMLASLISFLTFLAALFAVIFAILSIFYIFFLRKPKEENIDGENYRISIQRNTVLNRQRIALVDYIEKAQRQGLSDTQISSRLKAQGWDDIEIQQAQSFVREALGDN